MCEVIKCQGANGNVQSVEVTIWVQKGSGVLSGERTRRVGCPYLGYGKCCAGTRKTSAEVKRHFSNGGTSSEKGMNLPNCIQGEGESV